MFALPAPAIPVAHIARCHTHACWRRSHRRRVRAFLWRRYKAHPMPRCTWEPESSWDPATGANYFGRPWAPGRYRVRNPHSTAGGKFQILHTTWTQNGGTPYRDPHPAAVATPLEQERVARIVLHNGGFAQWSGC